MPGLFSFLAGALGVVSVAASEKAVEKVVEDVYQNVGVALQPVVDKWRTEYKRRSIARKLRQLLLVKTLLSPEKAIEIGRFYYPACVVDSSLDWHDPRRKLRPHTLPGRTLIRGVAGQGKSMYLRHLVQYALAEGRRLPIFVELRRLRDDQTLLSLISAEMRTVGLSRVKSDDQVLGLLGTGMFVLLLDAFDELPPRRFGEVVDDIERLSRRCEQCQIVATARHGTDLEHSMLFQTLDIPNLERKEVGGVLASIAGSHGKDAKALGEALCREPYQHVHSMLTTPLMVTLLLVKYRVDKAIPETVVEFYEGLFELLMSRHDRMKAGFRRHRQSGLSDRQLERVFTAVSYLSFARSQRGKPTMEVLEDTIREAGTRVGIEVEHPEAPRRDIVEITCLIVTDGDEWRFVHKSVQEYHAAKYITGRPEDQVRKFYAGVGRDFSTASQWSQVLYFLSMLDEYRFAKYFAIPHAMHALGISDVDDEIDASPESLARLAGNGCTRFTSLDAVRDPTSAKRRSFQWAIAGNALGAVLARIDWGHFMRREWYPIHGMDKAFREHDLSDLASVDDSDALPVRVNYRDLLLDERSSDAMCEDFRRVLDMYVDEFRRFVDVVNVYERVDDDFADI